MSERYRHIHGPMRMIPVEAHLLLNHVPVIGLMFGLVFVIIGIARASAQALSTGLQIFVVVGVLAVPVGASGLIAANLLATEPWLDASAVRTHQLAGILTVILLVALAGLASAVLFALRKAPTPPRGTVRAMTALALIALLSALWTAYLGGGLRHSELRGQSGAHHGILFGERDWKGPPAVADFMPHQRSQARRS